MFIGTPAILFFQAPSGAACDQFQRTMGRKSKAAVSFHAAPDGACPASFCELVAINMALLAEASPQ